MNHANDLVLILFKMINRLTPELAQEYKYVRIGVDCGEFYRIMGSYKRLNLCLLVAR